MTIPGCSGYGTPSFDYCYDPEDQMTAGDLFLYEECQAACMDDTYCKVSSDSGEKYPYFACLTVNSFLLQPGLVCQFRGYDEPVVNCTTADSLLNGVNMCKVALSGELVHMGNDANVAEFSLGGCQGDCDDDSDCQVGHRRGSCWKRSSLCLMLFSVFSLGLFVNKEMQTNQCWGVQDMAYQWRITASNLKKRIISS
jgi:hypothetical protein